MIRPISRTMNRRGVVLAVALCAVLACLGTRAFAAEGSESAEPASEAVFRLWTMGCAHVGTDLRVGKRESLAEAIRQSEFGDEKGAVPFDWDIALHVGDLSGNQGVPGDEEGREVVRQFAAAKKHGREHFYNLVGNHDASRFGEPAMEWFRTWVDPAGEHPEQSGVDADRRPFPVEGTWERYSFRAGNLLFLVMSDRNDLEPPVGRGPRGGYPAGAVTGETFDWWKRMVEENRDSIILSAHHHMLKETTVHSGLWEGMTKTADGRWRSGVHGYFPQGAPEGASYLYFVDGKPDAQAFEGYLAAHPGAIDLWIGGHSHTDPDDCSGGRSHVERKWDVTFINTAALTRHHGGKVPMSRLLTFTEGSRRVCVQCYLHTSEHAPRGFYAKAERTIEVGKPFRAPSEHP
ncbi:MAG: metallophosphoesterase [Planctomycetota bacterium]